jgi:hypothetical protein
MTVHVRKNAKFRKSTGKKPCKMFKSQKKLKNLKLAHSFQPLSICTNKNKSNDLKKAWPSKNSQYKNIKWSQIKTLKAVPSVQTARNKAKSSKMDSIIQTACPSTQSPTNQTLTMTMTHSSTI